jgi:hypothetical protein
MRPLRLYISAAQEAALGFLELAFFGGERPGRWWSMGLVLRVSPRGAHWPLRPGLDGSIANQA